MTWHTRVLARAAVRLTNSGRATRMSSALPAAASVAGVLLAVEVHHPGIDSLRLTPQVARAWKERLAHIRDTEGQPLRSSSPAHAFAALAGHGWEYR